MLSRARRVQFDVQQFCQRLDHTSGVLPTKIIHQNKSRHKSKISGFRSLHRKTRIFDFFSPFFGCSEWKPDILLLWQDLFWWVFYCAHAEVSQVGDRILLEKNIFAVRGAANFVYDCTTLSAHSQIPCFDKKRHLLDGLGVRIPAYVSSQLRSEIEQPLYFW